MKLTITPRGIEALRQCRSEGAYLPHTMLILAFLEEKPATSEKLKNHIDIPAWENVVAFLKQKEYITILQEETKIIPIHYGKIDSGTN